MKWKLLFCLFLILIPLGCWYDSPFSEVQEIPLDKEVFGWWEIVSDNEAEAKERMLVLPFSKAEYLIHYLTGEKETFYFRGYPVKIGDVAFVQLQVIGTMEGLPEKDSAPFYAVSYQLSDDGLTVRTLNLDLVEEEVKGSEALRKAFLEHKDDPDLFRDPGRFKRP